MTFDFTDFQHQVITEFRANQGRVGGPFEGADLALLTTIGARTGKRRTSPLAHLVIDGTPVVVASAMGADKNPDWFHNIRTNPVVTVEHGTETYEAVADAPAGAERDALFAEVVAAEPGFGEYQQKTTRPIPVVRLTRIGSGRTDWPRGLGDFLVEGHDWLRAELARLRLEAGSPGLSVAMREHCAEFCAALTQHHTGEDRGAFPMLAQRYPGLAPALRRLGEEHEVVGRLLTELRELIETYDPGRSDPDQLRAELDRLAARLEEHFRYEEQTVVAALNTLGPAPDVG